MEENKYSSESLDGDNKDTSLSGEDVSDVSTTDGAASTEPIFDSNSADTPNVAEGEGNATQNSSDDTQKAEDSEDNATPNDADSTQKAADSEDNAATDNVNDGKENSNSNDSYSWHSDPAGGGYTHSFNWSYEEMHEPINFDNTVKKNTKNRARNFGIIIGIAFAVAMVILAAAIFSDLKLATKDDIKGEVNVNIQVSDSKTPLENGAVDPEALEDFKNSTVVVSCDSAIGTGIVITHDGYIVTNYHVIEDAKSIQISLYDGSSYKATLVGYISSNDIAVLKINAKNLTPATFAKLENCYVSQRVYAVGTPAGATFAWSVSSGIISATNREAKFYDENNMLERKMTVIQTDTPVNPGNSGGPLINASCEVVGIITMKLSDDYVGMGFAIPSDTAIELIQKILTGEGDDMDGSSITKPTPQRGIVGIDATKGSYYTPDNSGSVIRVTKEFAENYPDSCFQSHASGIYILRLTPGLDAENKLKVGDVIVDIEDSGINTMNYLKTVLEGKEIGDKINITVSRNGKIFNAEIELK